MNRRVLAAWLLGMAVVSCTGDEGESTAAQGGDRPDRVVHEFRLTETSSGVPEWRLRADEARHFVGDAQTKLTGVELEFFRPDGNVRSRLTSERGMIEDATGDMVAEGKVHLVSTEGDTLDTEYLRYSKEPNTIGGPGPVRIAKPDRVLTGVGFTAKPDLTEYEVLKDVRIRLVDGNGLEDAGP